MSDAFKYLTSLLFLAIVVQVGFAGDGAFDAIDRADKDHQITKEHINALAIYGAAAFLAHRAWTRPTGTVAAV